MEYRFFAALLLGGESIEGVKFDLPDDFTHASPNRLKPYLCSWRAKSGLDMREVFVLRHWRLEVLEGLQCS